MSSLQEKFDQLLADQAELKRQFQTQAQEMFKGITKEFFDKNPGVQAIVWTQYTPYFNDGETCEFNVNDPTFTNSPNGEDVSPWGEYEGDDESIWSCQNVSHVLTSDRSYYKEEADRINAAGGVDADSCSAFERMLMSSEMEDVFLAMFGDHVKVIATRDGFDVEDYNHD